MQTILATFLIALSFLLAPQAAQSAPLLQEGKTSLYQRVVSHPEATLYKAPSEASPVVEAKMKPFTVLYVYERSNGWLNVGTSSARATGWIKANLATQWNQSLTLLFTPRTGRSPVFFYESEQALRKICEANDVEARITEMERAAEQGRDVPGVRAMEPSDQAGAVSQNRFYLMPILDVKETYEDMKLLRVASIDPGILARSNIQGNTRPRPGDSGNEGNVIAPKTGIAIVIDSSISMGPYINQCRNVVKTIYDGIEQERLQDSVGFAVVSFRSSTAARRELEYTAKVVSDFETARNRNALEVKLAQVKEATVSSHDFNEDSLAGVYQAIENLSWDSFDAKFILLVTDAGPLTQEDPYKSTELAPKELHDFAFQKGIKIIVVHVKTPKGKSNHDYAEKAYKALSTDSDGTAHYQTINAPNATTGSNNFSKVAQILSKGFVRVVRMTRDGERLSRPQESNPGRRLSTEEEARQLAERLGYAMQLEFLGKRNANAAPKVQDSWIADKDLISLSKDRRVPAVEVAVLLNKHQLNSLYEQLQTIISEAERSKKTDSKNFFQSILSASATMARDPNMNTQGKTLAQLGILGEFLDGLPYRSEVMALREEDWYRKSIGEQTAFINRLKSRLARYDEYDRDRSNWENFGSNRASDWVYRVPLDMLP